MGTIKELSNTSEFSISGWTYGTNDAKETEILGGLDADNNGFLLQQRPNGEYDWVVSSGSAGSNEPSRGVGALNQWQHFVVTFYPGYIEVYYNGGNRNSTDIATDSSADISEISILCGTNDFTGKIDDLRFMTNDFQKQK